MSTTEEPPAGEATGQPAPSSRQTTAPVKCAYVCPNGSRYGKVRKVVIPSRLRNRWDGVLQLIDDSIPIFGGCFHLVKVGENGDYARVSQFDEIEDQELYVALNNTEKLIKMDYKGLMNSSRSPSPPRRSQQSTASRRPKQRRQNDTESKFQKYLPRLIIKVYANDMYNKAPARAALEQPEVYERRANVFKNKICSAMDFVFQDIEESSGLTLKQNQSFRKMVDARTGRLVESPLEIEAGQAYVMCGSEEYREFVPHRVVRPFQCGKFSHERQRFLNNPRSAKVKEGKSSRKPKSQETPRDTARSEKESAGRQSDGYDSAQPTRRENGFHDSQEDAQDEYSDIPRFGEENAPLLTERNGRRQEDEGTEDPKLYSADYDRQNSEQEDAVPQDSRQQEEASARNDTPLQSGNAQAADDSNGFAASDGATEEQDGQRPGAL